MRRDVVFRREVTDPTFWNEFFCQTNHCFYFMRQNIVFVHLQA